MKVIEFFESVTIYKLFIGVILIPTFIGFCTLGLVQHKGTRYMATHEVDVGISIGGEPSGTITIALFGRDVPRTVRNFIGLATTGVDHEGKTLKYEGTTIHKIVRAYVLQGGDVFKGSDNPDGLPGNGAISIYGPTFKDENFLINHAFPGTVSMANAGPDTNACQFFLTLRATTFLDGKHVVFGKVIDNLELLHKIEKLEMDKDGKPILDVVMFKFAVRPLQSPYYISDDPYNVWSWLKTMALPVVFCLGVCSLFTYFMTSLDQSIAAEEALFDLAQKQGSGKKSGRNHSTDSEGEPETTVRRRRGRDDSIDGAEEVTMEAEDSKPADTPKDK